MIKRMVHEISRVIMWTRVTFNPRPKLIYIVEDNALYAKSLKAYLTLKFPLMKIKTFTVGEDCLAELHRNPTVIIMDHMLDNNTNNAATGLSIIEKIKQTGTTSRIILLCIETELDVFVKSLSLYGCTYLWKDAKAFRTIEQYIRTIS